METIARLAGVEVAVKYVEGPQGVRGRQPDLTRAGEQLGWSPQVPLVEGLARTYEWIEEQVKETL